jgi:hypothetical protein
MSSIARFNPQSESFVSKASTGAFAPKPTSRQGIVSLKPAANPGPQVLGAKQTAKPAVTII